MFGPRLTAVTLTLCVAVGLKASPVLIQSPEVVTVPEGGTVQFRCTLESSYVNDRVDKYDVRWFLSRDRNQIIFIHYIDGTVYRSHGFSERFQLSRDVASNSYILTIRGVQRRDSAVYICGIWGKIYGNGNRLNVTSAVAPVLTQSPSLERVSEGHTARLQCTMRNARVSDTDVHWYRQLPGQDTEWVLTHEASGSTRGSPGSTDRLQPSRDTSNNSFILTVTDVQPSDTDTYYCKVWGDISGSGTQLNVTKTKVVKTILVWIILGAVLGVTVVTGGILLIRHTLFGKKQSAPSGTAADQNTTADYENVFSAGDTQNSGDRLEDQNATYMTINKQLTAEPQKKSCHKMLFWEDEHTMDILSRKVYQTQQTCSPPTHQIPQSLFSTDYLLDPFILFITGTFFGYLLHNSVRLWVIKFCLTLTFTPVFLTCFSWYLNNLLWHIPSESCKVQQIKLKFPVLQRKQSTLP
uniref:uncharacterized protein isoform X2 n=1 Tax=Pristiophorus japonicus TaxID=55135 RepID=UPI00398E927B